MSGVRHFKKQFVATAALLAVLLAAVSGCGPTPSRGWDTNPDKLMEQIAESMRDLLIESNFVPLADGQPLPDKREMALGGRWPGSGTLFAWYQSVTPFSEFESCISGGLPFFKHCRKEDFSQAWWVAEGELGEAFPSEWQWLLGVKLEKYNLSYVTLVVVLNEAGDKALAYVDYHCPENCGSGVLYTLERRGDGWYVLESKSIWEPE